VVTILRRITTSVILTLDIINTTSLKRLPNKLLATTVTTTVKINKFIQKVLTVISYTIVKLYPGVVQKFGAVAKYTFIVGPKQLTAVIVKDRDILVKKAEKTLSFVKNRVIMLYRKL
jgi:hypothetical protein